MYRKPGMFRGWGEATRFARPILLFYVAVLLGAAIVMGVAL